MKHGFSERKVFIELPENIYSASDSETERLAQLMWELIVSKLEANYE